MQSAVVAVAPILHVPAAETVALVVVGVASIPTNKIEKQAKNRVL